MKRQRPNIKTNKLNLPTWFEITTQCGKQTIVVYNNFANGLDIWRPPVGYASYYNIERIQRYQAKTLKKIAKTEF